MAPNMRPSPLPTASPKTPPAESTVATAAAAAEPVHSPSRRKVWSGQRLHLAALCALMALLIPSPCSASRPGLALASRAQSSSTSSSVSSSSSSSNSSSSSSSSSDSSSSGTISISSSRKSSSISSSTDGSVPQSVTIPQSLGRRSLGSDPAKDVPVQKFLPTSNSSSFIGRGVTPGTNADNTPTQILWFWGSPETSLHIGQGETVQWAWFDDKEHSVEGTDKASQKVFVGKGAGASTVTGKGFVYNVTFDTPGEFSYRCHVHPLIMKGKVVVKPAVNVGGVTLQWYDGVTFGGASAIVEAGDAVTWEWADDLPHSLMGMDGSSGLFSKGRGANGDAVAEYGFKYTKVFKEPGTFLYFCAQHGETMRGKVTVVPKGSLQSGN